MKEEASWVPDQGDLDWIEAVARPAHPILVEMEGAAEPEGIPILDRASGRVLATFAANRPRIIEVGTAIGYSTLWLALAQPAGGTIATIDPNAERTDRARAFWRRAGIADARITIVQAKALDALAAGDPALAGPFDLAFIDAIKQEYLAYLDQIAPRLAPGALVVADNVLWSGRVPGSQPSRPDDGTEELRGFCVAVLADPRFEATILPVGDGLLVASLRP